MRMIGEGSIGSNGGNYVYLKIMVEWDLETFKALT
jgi:hypothetical protein